MRVNFKSLPFMFALLSVGVVNVTAYAAGMDDVNDIIERDLIKSFEDGVLGTSTPPFSEYCFSCCFVFLPAARDFLSSEESDILFRRECGYIGMGKASDCNKEQKSKACRDSCSFMSRATGRGSGGAEVGCILACLTMNR